MEHTCNDRCSWKATADSLTALGFPVKLVGKGCFGTLVVEREGFPFELARHKAWEAGELRLCTRKDRDHFTGAEPEWSKRLGTRELVA